MSNTVVKNSPTTTKKPLSDRELAKVGMSLSLGALVVTGLSNSPKAKLWHLVSAGAMVGFSAWHYSLYQSSSKKTRRS